MNITQAQSSDPIASQSELTPPDASRPGIPPALEQVIEHMRASYLADLRALEEKLRQRGPAMDYEPLAVLPSELVQPRAIRPTQNENANADFPDPKISLPPLAEAPPSQSAPAQERPITRFPEPLKLGAKGWVLLWIVCMLVGAGLGVLITIWLL